MQAHYLPPLCSMSVWKTETMTISRQKKFNGQECQRKLEERQALSQTMHCCGSLYLVHQGKTFHFKRKNQGYQNNTFYFNTAIPGGKPGQPMHPVPRGEDYMGWGEILLSGVVAKILPDVVHLICACMCAFLYAVEYDWFPGVEPLL